MTQKLLEHILSIVFVTAIFIVLITQIRSEEKAVQSAEDARLEAFLKLGFIDYDNPLHKALLKETMDVFYPGQGNAHAALLVDIENYRRKKLSANPSHSLVKSGLSSQKFRQLAGMYLSFVLVYIFVMALTYYGVQTLAIFRFVRMKQERESYLAELAKLLTSGDKKATSNVRADKKVFQKAGMLLLKAILKGALYFILFSPAYVIAYSFKTRFDTDSFFFMVLLGVISNGLLITYAQKFFTFLMSESRKGYVQTAIVKNMKNNYTHTKKDGIPLKAILAIKKQFPGHVFGHIYQNAQHQYVATLKEQASFLISGLVIIEMALNIQGHLCYELMQNILFQQFDVALTIVLGIFLVVKATEIFTDIRIFRLEKQLS